MFFTVAVQLRLHESELGWPRRRRPQSATETVIAWLANFVRREQTPGAKAHFDRGLTARLKPCPTRRRFDIGLPGQASRLSLRELVHGRGATGGIAFGCGRPSFSIVRYPSSMVVADLFCRLARSNRFVRSFAR